jgi:hypothetical protein
MNWLLQYHIQFFIHYTLTLILVIIMYIFCIPDVKNLNSDVHKVPIFQLASVHISDIFQWPLFTSLVINVVHNLILGSKP